MPSYLNLAQAASGQPKAVFPHANDQSTTEGTTEASPRPVLALLATLGRVGLQLVAPAGTPGVLAVKGPPGALTPGLRARLVEHKAALLALACSACGVVPFVGYTASGKPRCARCMPARCRGCFTEVPHDTTICAMCSSSPAVVAALAAGARPAAP